MIGAHAHQMVGDFGNALKKSPIWDGLYVEWGIASRNFGMNDNKAVILILGVAPFLMGAMAEDIGGASLNLDVCRGPVFIGGAKAAC